MLSQCLACITLTWLLFCSLLSALFQLVVKVPLFFKMPKGSVLVLYFCGFKVQAFRAVSHNPGRTVESPGEISASPTPRAHPQRWWRHWFQVQPDAGILKSSDSNMQVTLKATFSWIKRDSGRMKGSKRVKHLMNGKTLKLELKITHTYNVCTHTYFK